MSMGMVMSIAVVGVVTVVLLLQVGSSRRRHRPRRLQAAAVYSGGSSRSTVVVVGILRRPWASSLGSGRSGEFRGYGVVEPP